MVYTSTSCPQKVFTGLCWQSANHGLQAAGQTTPGGGGEIACAFPITLLSSRQILPLVKSDLQAFRPWESFPAPLYSTLLISPNFLGKAENTEGKGTPKLKVSLRDPWITSHYSLSKNRCFQELWWGMLNLWEPAPLPTSFHPPTARGSGWPLRAGRLWKTLPRSLLGEHLIGLETWLWVSMPPCLSIFQGEHRGCFLDYYCFED